MKICGGFYWEKMLDPEHRANLGSGMRAAAAISELANVELYTYATEGQKAELEAIAKSYKITLHCFKRGHSIGFDYLHACAPPVLWPDLRDIEPCTEMHVKGDVVVRFGMLEGSAIVDAVRCVFDPQSEVAPEDFHSNGSRAKHLAIVLNLREASALTGRTRAESAARELIKSRGCEVVVVKAGIRGAFVATSKEEAWVPAYVTPTVFALGSGDVFTAAFAFAWAVQRNSARKAAEYASLATAFYCANRFLPLPPDHRELAREKFRPFLPAQRKGYVYLASPFFSLGERWILEQLRDALVDAGMTVFSPLHDVGYGVPAAVAAADLKGLKKATVVLALIDGCDVGTVFEIGYAKASGISVVALSTKPTAQNDLTMLEGTDCHVVHDIASAVYRTGWLVAGAVD